MLPFRLNLKLVFHSILYTLYLINEPIHDLTYFFNTQLNKLPLILAPSTNKQ